MNLKENVREYKHLIGEVILEKNKQLKTVCNKINKLENEFRTPELEIIAGIHSYDTELNENKCKFKLNY